MPRKFSFDFPDELADKVVAESDRRKVTYADVIRQAVEEYFQRDRQRHNFEALLFEVVKNRAVVLRCFDRWARSCQPQCWKKPGRMRRRTWNVTG